MDKLITQLLKTNKSNNQTNTKYHEFSKPKYYGKIIKCKMLKIVENTKYSYCESKITQEIRM